MNLEGRGGGEAPGAFTVRERVRWSDVDAAGIVCYGMYLRFFERAESELFHSVGLPNLTLADVHGIWLVRRRIECDFLHPVNLDTELEIRVTVAALGRTSARLEFRVTPVGEQVVCAEGRYLLVAVDRHSMTPLPIPAEVRAALEPFLSAPALDDSDGNPAA